MSQMHVGYLGPAGTYSHLVAEKYFGRKAVLVPFPTILDICTWVSGNRTRCGIVPIENSSGGAIYETVDILLAGKPRICILEEVALTVTLALLGRRGQEIRTLYSHFAPLEHCDTWIRNHLPRVTKKVVNSTAVAARLAFVEDNTAALGNRKLAKLYNLDILHYPVQADMQNVTTFLAIAGTARPPRNPNKTTIAVKLPNVAGSLCTFLEAFRNADVNLCRIISRPIRGCPREYAFLVDIDGHRALPRVKRALDTARRTCVELRLVGSYPARVQYRS
jgi:prephenate dehydratase